MKPIKIDPRHSAAIEATLASVNGRASDHAFTSYAEVGDIAETAESRVLALLPKKCAVGAQYEASSGDVVPNSYKYARRGTLVRIERRASGWYLVAVRPVTMFKAPAKPLLRLTEDQRGEAIRRFCAGFGAVVSEQGD